MTKPSERKKSYERSALWHRKNSNKIREYLSVYREKNIPKRIEKLIAQPWSTLLTGAKQRARARGLKYDLTNEWAEARWTGECEITHLPFRRPEDRIGYKAKNFSPSIDRIDASGGYTQNNCRFILWGVNSFKKDHTDSDMLLIAEAIVAGLKK